MDVSKESLKVEVMDDHWVESKVTMMVFCWVAC
jgi:hypothetical protein